MVKLVYCITRKPGMTRADFSKHWENVHGPIGRRIPGLRRLVQSETLSETPDLPRADFDGMAELWFDDLDALRAARQTPEWHAATQDEANFIDRARVAFFITEEREID